MTEEFTKKMPINNEANRQKLAEAVVEAWDLKTLMACAIGWLEREYEANPEVFKNDWENFYGETDELSR